jgi:hypothetical protein
MKVMLLKTRRQQIFLSTLAAGLLVLFQNCAPPPQNTLCPKGQDCSSSGRAGLGSNSSSGRSPAGTGTTANNSNVGATTSGTSPVSAGTSPISTPMSPSTPAGLSFSKNLQTSLSVAEGAGFQLDVFAGGGVGPYKYEWYLNDVLLIDPLMTYSSLSDVADRYNKEGNYKVVVTDMTGAKITSATSAVSFSEPQIGCHGGLYAMMAGTDSTGQNLHELFQKILDLVATWCTLLTLEFRNFLLLLQATENNAQSAAKAIFRA